MTVTTSCHALYCEKFIVAFSGCLDSKLDFDLVFTKKIISSAEKSTSCLKVCGHIISHTASFQLYTIGNCLGVFVSVCF